MSGLVKATLQRIVSEDNQTKTDGDPVAVQFNPASLKLALSNTVEGGQSKGRQARQFIGKSSTELAFDLVFDTADEDGGGGKPRSVREKTALVEQFVVPEVKGQEKQAPPKVRFHWNDLIIDGVISSLNIDMDLFAADGTPLRAKVAISIKEQDAKYEFLKSGPGANQASPPQAGGQGAGAPGSSGGKPRDPTDRSALALAGESAADFAARMGLDPSAWRGLSGSLEGTLSLQAGLEIDFNSSLSVGVGLGASVGVEAGASLSLEASFGLEGSVGIGGSLSAGFSLSAAGGVGAAIETVGIVKAEAAAAGTRRAFGAPAPAAPAGTGATAAGLPSRGTASLPATTAARTAQTGTTAPAARPAMPDQPHPRLTSSGLPSPSQEAPPAPPPPQADPRTTSFGLGVPLRPRAGSAADVRSSAFSGHVPLKPYRAVSQVPETWDSAAPPWTQLPAGDRVRAVAGTRQAQLKPRKPCGCGGACSHRGGPPWR